MKIEQTKNENQWRVLVIRPRYEKLVAKQFARMGLVCYLPLRRELRQWHDRKKWVEMPLFNGYLFVQVTPQQQNKVFEVPGVMQYLRYNNQPALLPQSEIERIKMICAHTGQVLVETYRFSIGDEVAIQEGPFIGYKGVLVEKAGGKYLKIAIKSIALNVLVQIEAEKVAIRECERVRERLSS